MVRSIWMSCLVIALAVPARAQEPEGDAEGGRARQAFVTGTEHAREARWAEALTAFEEAARLRPHAVTSYNIGACERALGLYTRAQHTLKHALVQHEQGQQLPETLVERTRGFLKQLDTLLVRLTLTVKPGGAAIAVDGRPLEKIANVDNKPAFVAGTRPPGDAEAIRAETFVVVLDPGARVITLSRKGFNTAVVNRTFANGAVTALKLELDRLPATLRIRSQPGAGIVTVDRKDVGPTPLDVVRPAGRYHVMVEKEGFVPYESNVRVRPGERLDVYARLTEDQPGIEERWWFWASLGTVVATTAVVLYFALRPEPESRREEVSGGSFGYEIRIP